MTEKEQLALMETWLKEHKGIVFKVVRSYTSTDHDDLFQEIILRVWRSIPAFRGECSVPTWLYRIALNAAITWTKKEKKHSGTVSADMVGHQLLQESSVMRNEQLSWLYDQINLLEPVDRSLTLLLLEGYSYKEMAAMLGISDSNVGVKINRIKKQLIVQSKKI